MNSNSSDSPNKDSDLQNATNSNSEKITVETLGLISWYATGWLSADERARMHKLLNQYPELKVYLKDEQHIIQQVKENKSVLSLSALESTKDRLKRVMQRIDEVPQENTIQQASAHAVSQVASASSSVTTVSIIKNKVSHFFQALLTGDASIMKYASFASLSILVALLVAFIAPMMNSDLNQSDNTFHPATVQTAETKTQIATTQLLLGLNESTQNEWLENLLQRNNANLTKIPGKDGLYRIQFDRKLNANEIESLLNQLNSHKESIWFSGEAY